MTASAQNVTQLTWFITYSTWLELPWLLPAEINPNAIRTNANAISTMSNWGWNCKLARFSSSVVRT